MNTIRFIAFLPGNDLLNDHLFNNDLIDDDHMNGDHLEARTKKCLGLYDVQLVRNAWKISWYCLVTWIMQSAIVSEFRVMESM